MVAAVHTHAKLKVEQAAGSAGAYLTGVDLSKTLDGEEVAGIRKALLDHLVVALPDQTMSLDDLERLTDQLGGRDVTPFVKPLPDRPYVIRILKEPHEKLNFANAWHTDLSYLPAPPSFTLLYCLEAPPQGGDTIWANQYMAYDTLSKGLRETLLGLDAVHSAGMAYGDGGYLDGVKHLMSTPIEPSKEARREEIHPAVIAHAETGRPALYLNPVYTTRIAGWTNAESQSLLGHLYKHSVNENFTWRLKWAKGTLAIWDNRSTQHFAMNDYHGFRREMVRTSVKGSVPKRAVG
ncbi:MAG: TauD/TfdA family dioxygenase [Proteobacteria bacterium]|nr:TauD/TfdA family dioxygenase [Pseudomonadota bacterium]